MSLRDNLVNDALSTLRVPEAVVSGPNELVGDAVALMRKRNVGYVAITEHGKPIGILTERDILTKVLARDLSLGTPIADVMTSPVETIAEERPVADLIRRMHSGGFRHMPVVDATGQLTSVVSVRQLVSYLVEHFPAAVFNLPPDPAQRQTAREGA